MSNLLETEVKVFVADLEAVAGRVRAAGGTLAAARVFEHNIRYENAEEAFTPSGVVLRLRKDTRVRLTLKSTPPEGPGLTSGGVLRRFEAEVTVDDLDTMDLILQRLGFRPYVIYEKYRTTYELGDTEIVLDEMPYGNFVEIEGTEPDIEAALVTLGLQDAPRMTASYLMLFDYVKARLGLTFRDLTFGNFEDVWVPHYLFTLDSGKDD